MGDYTPRLTILLRRINEFSEKKFKPASSVLMALAEIDMGKHGKLMSGSLITLKYDWRL